MTTAGERIREIRQKRHKTLEDVANAVGLTSTSISKYESNKVKNIPTSNLEAIAEYLDVSVSYILGLDDPESAPLVLSIDEQILIEEYRKLPFHDQETVRMLVRRFLDVATEDESVVQLRL